MSKFLKAIERAELERAGGSAADTPSPRPGAPSAPNGSDRPGHEAPPEADGAVAVVDDGRRLPIYGSTLLRAAETSHEAPSRHCWRRRRSSAPVRSTITW